MTTARQRSTASTRVARTTAAFVASIALGLTAPPANATPEGWEFQTATGAVFQSGPADQTTTNVFLPGPASQPNNRHIITWDSLNLGSQETLNYLGLDGFAVLNRVNQAMGATEINGALNAMNGNVFIVNQAGVMFGQNATINVGSIYAAAGDILDSDFSNGVDRFFNLTGELSFEGTLNASDSVALLGNRVVNSGAISGRMIVMAIGNEIIINNLDSRISLRIDGTDMDASIDQGAGTHGADLTGQAGLSNSGTIETTAGGGVTLAAGDLYGLAIHHTGEIASSGGTVDLVASGGAIWTEANNPDVGTPGSITTSAFFSDAGQVNIAGPAVLIGAEVDAAGGNGILSVIGHDNVAFDGVGALIADGGSFGPSHGGTINVQAVNGTVYGAQGTSMSVKGGAVGGDGGSITIQGDSLALLSEIKVGAVNGAAGSLTLLSNRLTRIDSSTDALPGLDMSDLATSIVADGEYGRIGAADGQTLRTVDGHLLVASTQELRFETSLIDLYQSAVFQSNDLRFAILEADAAIRAEAALEFDGGGVFEQDVMLSSGSSLGLLGGDYHGTGTAHVGLFAAESLIINNNLGGVGTELGHLTVSAASLMDFGGHDSNESQGIHVAGNVYLDGVLSGADVPLEIGVQEALVVRIGGDLNLGTVGGQAINIEGQEGMDIEVGGDLYNASTFDIQGLLRMAAANLQNNGALTAQGGIELIATTGSLDTIGDLNTGADLLLQSHDLLSNVHDLTANAGSITLRSTNGGLNTTGHLQASGSVGLEAQGGTLDTAGEIEGQTILVAATDDVQIQGAATATGALYIRSDGGDISTTAALQADQVVLTAAGDTVIGETVDAAGIAIGAGGTVTVNAAIDSGENGLDVQGDAGVVIAAEMTSTRLANIASADGSVTTSAAISADDLEITSGQDTWVGSTLGATSIAVNSTGDTTINDAVGAVDLSVNAGGDVVIGGTLDATSIVLAAAGATTIHAAVTAGTGGMDVSGDGGVSIAAATTSQAQATVTSSEGSVAVSDTLVGESVALDSGTSLSVTGTVESTNGTLGANSGGDMTLEGTMTSSDAVALDAGGSIIGTGLLQAAATLGVTATGDAALAGEILAGDATTIQAGGEATVGDFAGTDLSVTSGGGTTLVGIQAQGTLDINAGGVAALDGNIDALAVEIDGGAITQLAGTTLTQTTDPERSSHVQLNSTGDITLAGAVDGSSVAIDGRNVTVNDVTSAGTIDVTSTETLISTGSIDAASVIEFTSGTSIDLAGTIDAEQLSLLADTGISIQGDVTVGGGGAFIDTDSGTLSIDAVVSSVTDDVAMSAGSIALGDGGSVVALTVEMNADGSIAGTGDISGDWGVTIEGGSVNLDNTITADAGDILVTAATTQLAGTLSGQTVALEGTDNLTVDADVSAQDVWLRSDAGTVTTNGSIQADASANWIADAVVSNGTVDAQGAVSAEGTNGVEINGTLSGGSIDLASTDATVTVAGDVTTPGDLVVTGQYVTLGGAGARPDIHANNISVTATEDLTGTGDLTGTAAVTLTSIDGLIELDGALNAQGDISVMSGSSLDLEGSVTAANVTITGQDETLLESTIDAAQDITLASTTASLESRGTTTAGGDVSLSGAGVEVDGLIAAGGDLDVDATGIGVVFNEGVSADGRVTVNSANSIDVATSGSITGDEVDLNSTFDMNLDGDVTASSSLEANGGNMTVSGTVDSSGTMTLQASGNFSSSGTVQTTDTLSIDAGIGLESTGELSASQADLTAGGSTSIDRFNGGSLQVNAGDAAVADIVTTGSTEVTAVGTVAQSGTLWAGEVTLTGDSITLDGQINSSSSVTLSANSMTVVGDTAVQAVTDLVLASRTAPSTGTMTVSTANRRLILGTSGTLSLLATVDGAGGVLVASADQALLIGGDIGASEALEMVDVTSPQLQIGGFGFGANADSYWYVQQINARGDIGLNAAGRDTLSSLPTVLGFSTGNWSQPWASLAVTSTSGDITTGRNQGFSYYGALTLDAGGTLGIGDVTALGDLTLRGETVDVWQESNGWLMEPSGGGVWLETTSIVSGGLLQIQGSLILPASPEDSPRFAGADGVVGVPIFAREAIAAFDGSAVRLVDGGRNRTSLLALDSVPPVTPGESDIIAAEQLVHDDPEVQYLVGNEDLTSLVALADLGVSVQDTLDTVLAQTQRARAGLITANLAGADSTGRVQVSRNRLNVRHAGAAVKAFNGVLAAAPQAGDLHSVGQDLATAWDSYAAQAKDQATEVGFRTWARDGDSPIQIRTDTYLTGLSNAFTRLELAGLTQSELAIARTYVTRQLEASPQETANTAVPDVWIGARSDGSTDSPPAS